MLSFIIIAVSWALLAGGFLAFALVSRRKLEALAATVEERTLAVQPAARVSYHERLKATYKRMGLKPREWMNE